MRIGCFSFFAVALTSLAFLRSAAAQNYSVLHTFDGTDGESPSALILGLDGNFYGTTRAGGQFGDGTIFKITPSGGLTTLHSFDGIGGIEPNGLVQGDDGNLYGTTRAGGSSGKGTIFKMNFTNAFATLHDFGAGRPFGGIVKSGNGDFYGRSGSGIFKFTSQGDFTSFPGGYGYNQSGENVDRNGLTLGPDGNLYGTQDNYPFCCNQIFKMTPSGVFTTLYSATPHPPNDISFAGPDGVLQGVDGKLYGPASAGVYQFTPGANLITISEPVGYGPGLINGLDGNLYGVSRASNNPAFFFRLKANGAFANLYTGVGNGGSFGFSVSLVQADDMTFYGTYPVGGAFGKGTIYKVSISNTPSQLLNISTRLRVLTNDNVLIAGFIIAGNASKSVIVRGIGPSLSNLGISAALADPVLELHEPDGSVVTNDDWRSSQAAIEATGIPPTNDLESAIVATLAPGAYTAVLRGNNNATGVGVVEVYDLNIAVASRLANISTRGFVNTGDNVLIAGLITGSATVLVRGIGPSLAGAGVPNALSDPMLELRDSNGTVIDLNDDWRNVQEAEITATGIPPTNNRESAILRSLSPGAYTAIVRGYQETIGVALVEVYHLSN